MTTGDIIGLALQVVGTLLTGWALKDEYGDRRPTIRPPVRPRVGNPWAGGWRSKPRRPNAVDVRAWNDRPARGGLGRYGTTSTPKENPETIAMAEYIRDVFAETREGLRDDWARQDSGSRDLHQATVALFDSLQAAHEATRKRVRLEMVGLAIVMAGTVVSSF